MNARPALPWSDFLRLHVVRKVAKVVNHRWNLGLGYVDSHARSVRPPRTNRHAGHRGLCQVIQDRGAGEAGCEGTAFETLRQLTDGVQKPQENKDCFVVRCHAGLNEIVAPIVLQGRVLGALLCGGFFSDQPNTDREAVLRSFDTQVEALALSPNDYRAARPVHPWLDEREVSFVSELLRAAAEEIAVYYGQMLEQLRGTSEIESAFAVRYSYDAIIGRSQAMQNLYGLLDRVVRSDSTVLIEGENGTGKELVARAIHFNSPRKSRRFVVTNCSAFNDNLLDSELFGHRRGAFTGAFSDKRGLFEAADTGTFFLDEIGDMSPALQVKVLRVLQEGTFTPVGDTETRHVDVRIIAATNRDLKSMVERGEFREDLYYRVNVINLRIPPLRERLDDIDLLVDHFLKKHAKTGRIKPKVLSENCRDRFMKYSWPGNVRELENEIERLMVLAGTDNVVDESLISPRIRQHTPSETATVTTSHHSLPEAVQQLEQTMIREALQRNNWNKTRTAAELEISRRNLIRLVQKYELEKESSQ